MDGRISIHRKIMERSWYSDTNTFATFIHCLLKANIQDKIRQWVEIKRGSFISSIGNLSDEVGITRKQMLLVLQRLEKWWELVTKRDNKKTLFIVVKYSDYQWEEMRKVQQRDNKGTSKEHQRDTTKEDKKIITKETQIVCVKNKLDISEILSPDEINKNKDELYLVWKMIEYGLICPKEYKSISDLIDWVRDMARDYLPRKEDWLLNWSLWKTYANQWFEYATTANVKQKWIKNSVRTSFSLYSKPRWKK